MIVIIQSNALHDNAEHLNALIGSKHVVSKELSGGGRGVKNLLPQRWCSM